MSTIQAESVEKSEVNWLRGKSKHKSVGMSKCEPNWRQFVFSVLSCGNVSYFVRHKSGTCSFSNVATGVRLFYFFFILIGRSVSFEWDEKQEEFILI